MKKLLLILLIPVLLFSQAKVVGYLPTWWYGNTGANNLPWSQFTHIIIFAAQDASSTSPYFKSTGIDDGYWFTIYKNNVHNAGGKLLLSVTGGYGQVQMPIVAADPVKCQTFVDAACDYAIAKGFDGIEIDWEFPRSSDNVGWNRLIRLFREQLDTWEPDGILSTSVNYLGPWNSAPYYPDSMNAAFDMFQSMSYTMWMGPYQESPYYSGYDSPINNPTSFGTYHGTYFKNPTNMISGAISAGWDIDKFVVGISFEGTRFQTSSMNSTYSSWGFTSTVTNSASSGSYPSIPASGRVHDAQAVGNYVISGGYTYTFHDTNSVRECVRWIKSEGYGGVMIYDVPCGYDMTYGNQLMTVVNREVQGWSASSPVYTITASASAGGSISPSGGVEVDSNDSQIFTFSATAGYELDSCVVDGTSYPDSTSQFTFSNVSANHSITVYFSTEAGPKLTQASGTYLVDENGDYKILMHDAGWGIFVFINRADAYDYLDTRKDQGFSAILTALPPPWLLVSDGNTYKGENYYGYGPWGATPFTTYSTNYWANADSIINYAESIGMTLIIVPAFIGYNCASDGYGWASEMNARTNANMTSYGNWLANRYGEKTNIIWSSGGDSNPSTCTNVQSRLRYMVNGVTTYDPYSLWTNHNQRGTTGQDYYASDNAWLTLNSIYTDSNDVNELALTAVRVGKPYFGIEGRYEINEGGVNVNPQVARKQAYWPMLMGASGWCYGHFSVYTNATGWKDSLNSLGVARMRYAKGMFESYDWWKLRPDTSHNLVTSGYGTFGNYDYVGAGISSDSTFAIIYLPLRKTITINTNLLNRDSVNWYWFNVNDSSKTFYKSTGRSAGLTGIPSTTGDWVLLLESYWAEGGEDPPPTYIITASAGAGGTISPSGDVAVDSSENQVFTITPNEGFELSDLLIDGEPNLDSTDSYTFVDVDGIHTIAAYFTAISPYVISTTSLDNAILGSSYHYQLQGAGSVLDWRILRGRLQEGLWMDWNGVIQGTTNESGSKTITVVIRDRGTRINQARKTLTLTAASIPDTPTLTAPSNGATGVAVDTLVSWSSVSGATKYHVQIDNNSDFGSPIVNDSTVTVTYKSMGGLNTSTQHYWRVRAGNTSGWSDYTSSRTFTTAAAEGGPISLVTSAMFTPANITADSCAASITIPSGTNQLALAYLSTNVKVAYDSVKWGSQSFTLVAALDAGGANRREIWQLVNPSAATGSVVAYRDDNAYVGMIVAVFNNVNQSDPIGNSNTSYGTSTSASVSVSSSSGNVVVDCLGGIFTGSTTFSQGAGQTVVQEAEDTTVPMGMSYKSGTTTTTLTWTLSGSQSWRQGAVELINEP